MGEPEEVKRYLQAFMQGNTSTETYNEYVVPYNQESSGFGNYDLRNTGTAERVTANMRYPTLDL